MKNTSSQKRSQKRELDVERNTCRKYILQKISVEKSRKILSESGLRLAEDELKEVIELLHHIAELIINGFIVK
ncbi:MULTISPECIES: hypothetical protein [Chryseobacterium]|nr:MULTISPECIES: hypothetical protein [Chryseobacterium]